MKEILEPINWIFIAQIKISNSFGMKSSIDKIFDIYAVCYTDYLLYTFTNDLILNKCFMLGMIEVYGLD